MWEPLQQLNKDVAKHAALPVESLSDAELTEAIAAADRLDQMAAKLEALILQEVRARGLDAIDPG